MSFATTCPICDAGLALADDAIVDELLSCDECATELVVVSTTPAAVEEAPQVEEDWGE